MVVLFTAFWSLKTMHVLVFHHHTQAEHPVCEAAHDQKSAHIHDERWAKEDCTLCAFVVSVQESFSIPELRDILHKLPESTSPDFYQAPGLPTKANDAFQQRGPPMA